MMDHFTKKKRQVYIRSKFFNKYETMDSWRVIETWKEHNTYDFMDAATIYNPDNPYDMIEINPHGDPFTHPIKSYTPNDSQKKTIDKTINNLQDLIDIVDENPITTNIEYNIDLISLHKILPSLKKLNNMIGMEMLKENIVDQLLYYIQNLHINKNTTTGFMNTVL